MTNLDVCNTVVKIQYQGVMVQTPEQYFDIFKGLRDEVAEVATREEPGYYDLSARKDSSDGEDDEEDVYNNHDKGGSYYNEYFGLYI